MIKNITAGTHVSFHSHSTLTSYSISFLSLTILVLSGSRYNLWSYRSCSFLQYTRLYIMQFSPIYEAIHHAVSSNLWSYTSCTSLQFMKLYIMQFSPIYEAIHHAVSSNLWRYTSCNFLQFMKLHIMQFSPIYEAIHHAVFPNLWSYTSCSFLQFMKIHFMQFSPIYEAIHHAVFSNLWSYTSCSFLQFPISFSHKRLMTDQHQHCSQTQSTVYSQCHWTSVTSTFRKILNKHTHTHSLHFNSQVFRKQEGQQNILKLQWALI